MSAMDRPGDPRSSRRRRAAEAEAETIAERKIGDTRAHERAGAPDETPDDVRQAARDPANRFGKFVLLEALGRGGMGFVHRAWDTILHRPVALKFIREANVEDTQRFQREAQLAARLNHPHIVPIHEIGERDGRPYLAMEFVDGVTLEDAALSIPDAVRVFAQVARAIDFAHRQGILHRDLKPGNVMIDGEGRPYVMDFGLARSLRSQSNLTLPGQLVGTPAYMSPEQATCDPATLDARADVYSLGASLYGVLTGRPPHEGASPLDVIRRVVDEEPVPPRRIERSIPIDLEAIVLRAMARDRSERHASAAELAEDLEGFLQGRPITRRPPAGRRSGRRPRRRVRSGRGGAIAAGSAGALGAVLLVAWLAGRGPDAPPPPGPSPRTEPPRQDEAALLARAKPSFDQATRALEEAVRDLYRPGADLEAMRERLADAVRDFGRALDVCPGYAEAFFGRARAHALRFEFDAAEADYGRAIERDPTYRSAYLERGQLRLERHVEERLDLGWVWNDSVAARFASRLDAARADLLQATRMGEGETTFPRALLAFADGDLQRAIDLCEEGLAAKETREELHLALADAIFFSTGLSAELSPRDRALYAAALEHYARASELRANDFASRIRKANVLLQLRRTEEATREVEAALSMRPDDVVGRWIEGRCREQAGDAEAALRSFERGLAIHPDSFLHRIGRATIRAQQGALQEALVDVERAIEANPGHYHGWYLRGSIRNLLRDPEGALADFDRSARLDPTFHSVWYNLGAVHANLGHVEEARVAFRRAIELGHPDRARIERILEQLGR